MRERIAKEKAREKSPCFILKFALITSSIPHFTLMVCDVSPYVYRSNRLCEKLCHLRYWWCPLIKDILEEKKIDPKEAPARKVQYEISTAKNSGLSWPVHSQRGESFSRYRRRNHPEYQKKWRQTMPDFDDILIKPAIFSIPAVPEYFTDSSISVWMNIKTPTVCSMKS